MAERLQKWLAARGFGSRREIERWIEAGRVSVDGRPAVLGQQVTGTESIAVDGRPVRAAPPSAARARTILYHKPAGEICTRHDPQGRRTVFDSLPALKNGRWVSVGRLDLQTDGLLLFTTDGELASRLMHPGSGLEREYAVRVQGELDDTALQRLRQGVELDDGPARCLRVEFAGGEGGNRWYRMVLGEGRNRVVRRLVEAVGGRVSRLIRVRFGPASLPRDLPRGRYRSIEGDALRNLYAAAGLPPPQQPESATGRRSRRPSRSRSGSRSRRQ